VILTALIPGGRKRCWWRLEEQLSVPMVGQPWPAAQTIGQAAMEGVIRCNHTAAKAIFTGSPDRYLRWRQPALPAKQHLRWLPLRVSRGVPGPSRGFVAQS